jgi:hypothetical protein
VLFCGIGMPAAAAPLATVYESLIFGLGEIQKISEFCQLAIAYQESRLVILCKQVLDFVNWKRLA